MKNIIVYILFCLILANFTFAANDLMALQGTVNITGTNNISVTIWDNPTGGNKVYDSGQDFINSVRSGRYDIFLGSGSSVLNLLYGRTYYLDMSINNQDFDFNSSERQAFQSSLGKITDTYINNSAISSAQVLDGSLSGDDIADDSVQKTKIEISGTWNQSEIPSLTSAWPGTLDASRIISSLLLNVNSSQYLNGISSSAFLANDTALSSRMDSLNASSNIKSLGFNTTSELDTKYYSSANPSNYVTNSTMNKSVYCGNIYGGSDGDFCSDAIGGGGGSQDFNLTDFTNISNRQGINYTTLNSKYVSIESDPQTGLVTAGQLCAGNGTGVNCNVTPITAVSQLFNDLNYVTNDTVNKSVDWSNIYNRFLDLSNFTDKVKGYFYTLNNITERINGLYLNISDQRYNLTARIDGVNTSANIKKLGFNLTTELQNMFVALGAKLGNSSSEINAAEADPQIGLATAGQWCAGNGTGVNCNVTPVNFADTNTNVTSIQVTGSATKTLSLEQPGLTNLTATWTDMAGGNSTDQIRAAVNDSVINYVFTTTQCTNINSSANVKKLGFNTTAELDSKYITIGTKLGNSTSEINAVEADPQIGVTTAGQWCAGNGTGVNCNVTPIVDTDTVWQINATAFVNESGKLGWNFTTLDSNFIRQTEYPNLDTDSTDDMTTADNISIYTKISNINRSANFKSLGFNLTSELDTRYLQNTTPGITNIAVQNINVNGSSSSAACSGTDKVTQVTLSNGALSSVCETDDIGLPYFNFTTANSSTSSNSVYNRLFVMPLSSSGYSIIECTMLAWSNGVGVGVQYNFTITGASSNSFDAEYFSAATTKSTLSQSSGNTWAFSPTTSQGALVVPYKFYIFSTRSGAGNLIVGHKSETATQTITVAGSYCHEMSR